MLRYIILSPLLCLLQLNAVLAQGSALNIPGIHQLVSYSQSENRLQNDARDKQAAATANESANRTMLAKFKDTYRTLQQRYNTLGTAIDAANIGFRATPMVSRIISNQSQLYGLAQKNPVILPLAYQTELDFVDRAHSLVNYLIGLSASIGDINQMRLSDRKILFDFMLGELSSIQDLSGNLLRSVQYGNTKALIRSVNPFQDYVDMDKAIVGDIIINAKYLKK